MGVVVVGGHYKSQTACRVEPRGGSCVAPWWLVPVLLIRSLLVVRHWIRRLTAIHTYWKYSGGKYSVNRLLFEDVLFYVPVSSFHYANGTNTQF